jgi:hypothetical protein
MRSMKKQHAIDLLGGTAKLAYQAMGYTSIHAIYMWPDDLPMSISDRVNGCVARLKEKETRREKRESKK